MRQASDRADRPGVGINEGTLANWVNRDIKARMAAKKRLAVKEPDDSQPIGDAIADALFCGVLCELFPDEYHELYQHVTGIPFHTPSLALRHWPCRLA